MPSTEPIPEITELVTAYMAGVASGRPYADQHDGALHDILAGQGALLWRRVAENDRDNFRRIYFDTAPRETLDEIITRRYGVERVEDNFGQGAMNISRSTTTGGAGTFWAGTRIRLNVGGGDDVRYYQVTTDTPIGAVLTALVPVTALALEEKTFDLLRGSVLVMDFEDPIWDATWKIDRLMVSAGVIGETNDQYRERARTERIAKRVGYVEAIRRAMADAGASVVAFFASDFLGEALDDGLNRVYVADAGYQTNATLLKACRLALPDVAIAGASVQALAMTRQNIAVNAVVRMFDTPERFDQGAIARKANGAILQYFQTLENPFIWRAAGIRGAIFRAVANVQTIEITTSSPEPTLATLFSSAPLPRFSADPWGVSVNIAAPT